MLPGSIDTLLAGGELKESMVKLPRDNPERRYASFTTDAQSRAATEELLLELRRRIIRPRDRRREPGTTGTAALTQMVTGPLTGSSAGINPSLSAPS